MEAKIIFVLCLQLVISKNTFAQCIGGYPEAYAPFGVPSAFTSGLAMQMPMVPCPSFSVMSDDLFVDGVVSVSGTLPFLGTVGLEGILPAAGQGTVLYRAGNGEVGIVREMGPGLGVPVAGIGMPGMGPLSPLC